MAKTSTHLPTPEGWKAELDWVAGYVVRQFTCPKAVIHSITSDVDKDWTVDMQGQEQGQGQGPSLQGPGQGQDYTCKDKDKDQAYKDQDKDKD